MPKKKSIAESIVFDDEYKATSTDEVKSHRARLLSAQADRAELLMQIAKGELIESKEVEFAFTRVIDFFLSELKLIVPTLAADIAGKGYAVIEKKMSSAIDSAINKARLGIERELLTAKKDTKTKIDRKVRDEVSGAGIDEQRRSARKSSRSHN